MKFTEKYGASIDEAIKLALIDLKASIENVTVTVLQEPVKGFFGIGSKLAKVRVETKDTLDNGELPWGWFYMHKEFIDKIQNEWKFFLNQWVESRNAHPRKQYAALKSILQYAYEVQKLCDKKGETFSFWCSEILISKDWLKMRKDEMARFNTSMDEMIAEYEIQSKHETQRLNFAARVSDDDIWELIKYNNGILQKDFYELFDNPYAEDVISERLYYMAKEGRIERTKSGNSYILKIK